MHMGAGVASANGCMARLPLNAEVPVMTRNRREFAFLLDVTRLL